MAVVVMVFAVLGLVCSRGEGNLLGVVMSSTLSISSRIRAQPMLRGVGVRGPSLDFGGL